MTTTQTKRSAPALVNDQGGPRRKPFKPDIGRWTRDLVNDQVRPQRKPGLTKAQQEYFAGAQTTDRQAGAHDKLHLTPKAALQKQPPKAAIKKQAAKTTTLKTKDPDRSLLARDDKNRVCKARPNKLHARRAGGGASKEWVPWCKK